MNKLQKIEAAVKDVNFCEEQNGAEQSCHTLYDCGSYQTILTVLEAAKVALEEEDDLSFEKESKVFEEWAQKNRLPMSQHPLHYLFLDRTTDLTREAWKVAMQYTRDSRALDILKGLDDE